MYKNKKICVVLPAYNAEKTLALTVSDLPDIIDDIILVDDVSSDNTIKIAEELGLFSVKHEINTGYGGNQKTCYRLALERGADVIIMIHPDYQYDPKLSKYFAELIIDDYFDVILGTRIRSRKEVLAGGMPLYKYLANRLLTITENIISGQNLSEWHTGMRAYSKEALNSVNFNQNSDDFVFDSQMLFRLIAKGWRIGEIPVPIRYQKESSSISFWRSMRYGILTLVSGTIYLFGGYDKNK